MGFRGVWLVVGALLAWLLPWVEWVLMWRLCEQDEQDGFSFFVVGGGAVPCLGEL